MGEDREASRGWLEFGVDGCPYLVVGHILGDPVCDTQTAVRLDDRQYYTLTLICPGYRER